eukprot:TRINITY_DN3204_c0_g1_i4.p1 TRINITY_DN3204_c0_g1~~TRINITY_DN3204_c0_g1_i4.p1  ORF type:complete len:411 (-),score=89.17 TRINITY_DN3204_c0_g1_i4:8-1204(-)
MAQPVVSEMSENAHESEQRIEASDSASEILPIATSDQVTEAVSTVSADESAKGTPQASEPERFTRMEFFEQGLRYELDQQYQDALRCFMCCLSNIQEDTRTPEAADLPRFIATCLQHIATLLDKAGQHEESVKFVKAEKAIYESIILREIGEKDDGFLSEAADEVLQAQTDGSTAPASPSTDKERLQRDVRKFSRLSRYMANHQKHDLAQHYASRAIELKQQLEGAEGLLKGMGEFNMTFADLGRQAYQAAMEKYRDSVAAQLEHLPDFDDITVASDDITASTTTMATAANASDDAGSGVSEPADSAAQPSAAEAPVQGDVAATAEQLLPATPQSRGHKRKFKDSAINVAILLGVLLAILVGVLLLGHTVSLVAERGFYHRKVDDSVFNGIKLRLKDP